ncbi:MAG TPA: EAL domain-containing protein, partial [Usitatibacteraceae bacterium]|nr:EAL domain-containing protein [Usitatibacteraceae bacterium]
AYLRDLRLDRLKIDQSFVRDLAHGPRARDLLRGIVELGHGLGITVVAEGVETGDEASMLERLACDEAQGYHFGHPAARAEVEAFLARAR